MKAAIDSGHGKEYQGKWSPILDESILIKDLDCIDGTGRFREYLFNRKIKNLLLEKCSTEDWVELIDIVPENNDISLNERKRRITSNNCGLSISIHANAIGMGDTWEKAKGFSVYTSKGQNSSDKFAQILYNNFKAFYEGELKILEDKSDGDSDYEQNFAMVTGLNCPSVLIECGFFTNKEEVQMLMAPYHQSNIASIIKNSLIDWNNA